MNSQSSLTFAIALPIVAIVVTVIGSAMPNGLLSELDNAFEAAFAVQSGLPKPTAPRLGGNLIADSGRVDQRSAFPLAQISHEQLASRYDGATLGRICLPGPSQ